MIFSFIDQTPPARFDDVPWTEARIEESDTSAEPSGSTVWTQIDALTLDPVDTDPSKPQSRDLTTSLASNTPDLWYRIIWADAASGTSLPTVPIQNFTPGPYATTDELFRVLKVRQPTSEQVVAGQEYIDTATLEINRQIDWAPDHAPMTNQEFDLCKRVCVDRAADLWRHTESAPGILGVLDEGVPTTPGRYSFARYVARLSKIKDRFGIA